MQTRRHRLALLAALCLALSVVLGLALADLASAKKKKGKAGATVDITKNVNAAIPDAQPGPAGTDGRLTETIVVGGKRFKGMRVRDVNLTLQTTGSGPAAAGDLFAELSAPNGSTTILFGFLGGGQSIGPLTMDDESVNALQRVGMTGEPPFDATELAYPWAGTAQPFCFRAVGGCPLALLDNGPVTGTWTLSVFDAEAAGSNTSILNSWRLKVATGKAYRTK